MEKPKTVVGTLQAARTLLIKKGWIRHAFTSEKGYCAVGTLKNVNGPNEYKALVVLAYAVVGKKDLNWGSIVHNGYEFYQIIITKYNDSPTTRERDVLRKFDQAIELAQKLGKSK